MLVNYTFLTSETSMNEPNVYAGRQEQIEQGISNIPLGDQEPAEFDDWDQPITTPLVAETLQFHSVPVRGEQEWEYGLHRVLEEMTEEGLLILWDRRLQIEICRHDGRLAWAFPLNQQSWVKDLKGYIQVKPSTQVMLWIADSAEYTDLYEKLLRHQIGHVLWSLQHSAWCNECYRATREWKKWSK
jgi:hypothetical protein